MISNCLLLHMEQQLTTRHVNILFLFFVANCFYRYFYKSLFCFVLGKSIPPIIISYTCKYYVFIIYYIRILNLWRFQFYANDPSANQVMLINHSIEYLKKSPKLKRYQCNKVINKTRFHHRQKKEKKKGKNNSYRLLAFYAQSGKLLFSKLIFAENLQQEFMPFHKTLNLDRNHISEHY